MLFNSTVFLLFFAGFSLCYWLARGSRRARNGLIVGGSFLFYGWWDWRFLSLLFLSSALDYGVGRALARTEAPRARKAWLGLSVAGNLGVLGFFKYFDFFAESFAELSRMFHAPVSPPMLNVVLPVGISFYTFQTMSYSIDVYRREMAPTRDFLGFLAFVSFFPQLVAGPIERARHLLPQFGRTLRITAEMVEEGLWLILWGLFKKVALADNLAPLVDLAYQGGSPSAPTVALGTIAFGFQIYCDFSGYSDIARGLARWLGFDIMVNFNLPYAAKNLREFWRRWHISLSTWLRDYVYISLGGSRAGERRAIRNLLITFALAGLWHGAAWNFVLWGLWHGAGLAGLRLVTWSRNRRQRLSGGALEHEAARESSGLRSVLSWAFTLAFVFYGWLLFRAASIEQAGLLTAAFFHWTAPMWLGSFAINVAAFTAPLILMEAWQWHANDRLAPLRSRPWAKWPLQAALFLSIALYWEKEQTPFIYFQF